MTHTFVTIIASVPFARIDEIRTVLQAFGNPASDEISRRLNDSGLHFASLNIFEASAGDRGHLVLEFSGDGEAAALIAAVTQRMPAELTTAFAFADDRGDAALAAYLSSKTVPVGAGLLSNPGLCFSGTPGMSVGRIREEADLARRLTVILAAAGPKASGLEALTAARAAVAADADTAWALEPAAGGVAPNIGAGALNSVGLLGLIPPLLTTYFWPAAIPVVLALAGGAGWTLAKGAGPGADWPSLLWRALESAACCGFWALVVVALATVATIILGYGALRRQEASDVAVDRPAPPGDISRILQRENRIAQNHLAALSVIKGGVVRQLTLRLGFWVIGQFAARFYAPGFLGPLGTIHFARWVRVPGTRDLLFLSNFGGSWESYLEDFISQAHGGLTGVWSNTQGFPRANNLFLDGATDGDRFKWWARRQQTPTSFWYSAYPTLTTANIRLNARIRQGLAVILTEDEARAWLALFGSAPRPVAALETNEIQSLAFGGLGFLPEGTCLAVRFCDDGAAARAFLRALLPSIAFADGRYHGEGVFVGLAASGLRKLELPGDAFETLPPAFLDGMAAPWRSRILGDEGKDAPEHWRWGGSAADGAVDAALVLLAKDPASLAALIERVRANLGDHGCVEITAIPLAPQPVRAPEDHGYKPKYEPFGFVDGISQPVIRGTYKAIRGADPIHLVEPGEFILGYPDNLGTLPPTPLLAAIHDPDNHLATAHPPTDGWSRTDVNAPRDLGRNGTFLAIRQLRQDVEGFWAYCEAEAARLDGAFPDGMAVSAELIGAKIVWRWPDGSPLVRYPRWPASRSPTPAHALSRASDKDIVENAVGITAAPHSAPMGGAQRRGTHLAAAQTADFPPDNDFLLGGEDPQATRCPFGAHIRRSNPRESFDPGSQGQLAISNRHRILRVGRRYQPQAPGDEGILFMALNSDYERQFEFVQQTWLRGASFQGLSNEMDPLTAGDDGEGMTVPTRDGPLRLKAMPSFVTMVGGGYFFLPGKRTLEFLAAV